MQNNLTSALVLAGYLGLAVALPASATEDTSAEVTRLEAESARYSGLAQAEAKRQKHYAPAVGYQAKSRLYASEAQQLRDAVKRVALN